VDIDFTPKVDLAQNKPTLEVKAVLLNDNPSSSGEITPEMTSTEQLQHC
jgi:hypothetical protein